MRSRVSIKKNVKKYLSYESLEETEPLRTILSEHCYQSLPTCPPYEGDFLYHIAAKGGAQSALEIGFATGSTAIYMLAGMNGTNGQLISIDYRQKEHYGNLGCRTVRDAGFASRHILIEDNANIAVPDLFQKGNRFDLIYVDAGKVFDFMAVILYYTTRMLQCNGVLVFDDTRMPSIHKVIALLLSHYAYEEVDYTLYGEDMRVRLWYLLTTRSLRRPFRAFKKLKPEEELPVSTDFTFWKRF